MATQEKPEITKENSNTNSNQNENNNSFLSTKKDQPENLQIESPNKESNFDELNQEPNPSISIHKHTPSNSSIHTNKSKANRRYATEAQDADDQIKKNLNKEEEVTEANNKNVFESDGKFMQINPHFSIFNKQIYSLRESIYTDTKKCLILKGAIQESSNILRQTSNDVIKDIVSKIYDLRALFEQGNLGLNKTTGEVSESLNKLNKVQTKARKEIIDAEKRITECEKQIGYRLLGKPCYSFMKNNNITNVKSLVGNNKENNTEEGKNNTNNENNVDKNN